MVTGRHIRFEVIFDLQRVGSQTVILPQHIEFNGKTIECKKALDVKDKQHMNNGGHNQNPSVYGAPPAAAGYPPPGYPAPPMPGAYGAYPPYGGVSLFLG